MTNFDKHLRSTPSFLTDEEVLADLKYEQLKWLDKKATDADIKRMMEAIRRWRECSRGMKQSSHPAGPNAWQTGSRQVASCGCDTII